MNRIHLSKSKYCQCVQCKKMFWLGKYRKYCASGEDKTAIFETGHRIGELAKGLFGDYEDVPFDITLTPMIERTEELLQNKPNIITEASFSYDNNFCSVDILKNDEDGVEIYEVKSSAGVKDIYLDDASYQCYVLSNIGLNVKKVCIVHINNKYVLNNELDIKELFTIVDITDIAKGKQDEIRNNIEEINEFMNRYGKYNEPDMDIGECCFKPYKCDFWDYCTRDLPKPNVFDIADMNKDKMFEKYYEGKVSFEDLENEDMNPKFMEQIDFEIHNRGEKVDRKAIEDIMNSLKYPLYFIDYETCQYAIPEIEGTRAYQQIPFQYSLHIVREDGSIEHKEFLAEAEDDNIIRSFAESLIKDISEDGSVIVYNRTMEATRNKEIGEMYTDLKEEMERINNNIVDFVIPFKKRQYYKKEMKGSASLKNVLPALYPNDPELDYHNLPLIHDGGEAPQAFMSLRGKTKEEQEAIREGLLKYCGLDTYALVKIWEKFKEVTK